MEKAIFTNAICLIIDEKTMYKSMDDSLSGDSFIITSKPHKKRVKGFPLDCLSIHIPTGRYYYDLEGIEVDEIDVSSGFAEFFRNSLSFNHF